MTATTSTSTRDAYIAGLRALADYLSVNPDVPVPVHGSDILVGVSDVEDDGWMEVKDAAIALLADVTAIDGGYRTCRFFGPVGYKVFALTRASMARHRAEATYRGCITPDEAA